jgi:hypothetical protein
MAWLTAVLGVVLAAGMAAAAPVLERLPGEASAGTIEITGVAASDFRPEWWEAGTLNWNYDARAPLVEPRPGKCRNIYAPTVTWDGRRWRVYYGAWDGVDTGNDRIYTMWTDDFLTFHDRHMVIDHGVYVHVCNCCAIRLPDGQYRMMCTAYPHQEGGLNRPAAYSSPDGLTWNGTLPYVAQYTDLITMDGYAPFDQADMNGMNAILYEDGWYRLYFGDFSNFDAVHRASSRDFRHFTYDGPALEAPVAVNDVKRFGVAGQPWYLMAAHMNGDQMWYALSRDGQSFGPRHLLTASQSEADRYMVAVGWVTDGRRVLGCLYGAGAVPSLDQNRLFAKWLQKRVTLRAADGQVHAEATALGPDMLRLRVPAGVTQGRFRVQAEDGQTVLGLTREVTVRAGERWRLNLQTTDP